MLRSVYLPGFPVSYIRVFYISLDHVTLNSSAKYTEFMKRFNNHQVCSLPTCYMCVGSW